MQLHRIAAAANEHDLGYAACVGQLAVAEIQPAAVHCVDLNIALDPVGADTAQVSKFDVFAGDVAADPFADGAVGRFGGQFVEFGFLDLGIVREQFIKLRAIDGHPRIFYADAVRFQRIDRLAHDAAVAGKSLLCRKVHLDQIDIEPGCHELLQNALEGDLCHLVTMQNHQRLLDLDF